MRLRESDPPRTLPGKESSDCRESIRFYRRVRGSRNVHELLVNRRSRRSCDRVRASHPVRWNSVPTSGLQSNQTHLYPLNGRLPLFSYRFEERIGNAHQPIPFGRRIQALKAPAIRGSLYWERLGRKAHRKPCRGLDSHEVRRRHLLRGN